MKKLILIAAAAFLALPQLNAANPKHEFRGAWLHTVGQRQYSRQSTEENKAYLRNQLDSLKLAGVNAIVFQVRPSSDSFYPSELEPWSRFLSGTAGVAPDPVWDPLQFMIDESHARGMELHAWLNPYRVTTNDKEILPDNHIYFKHPDRFLKYGKQMYFDPGIPENRQFIEEVVKDIITRYDLDAIHMDDYFYPYPVGKVEFPDTASYAKYGNGMDRGDWRRQNVDLLIEGLHNVIQETKPWVRLGISPFGVWRNKSTDPRGSETRALQNYDALYADVLLWTEKGWVDYMVPQLYWELTHKNAPYLVLIDWWNDNANGRHMYIGESVYNSMQNADLAPSKEKTQLNHKMALTRNHENVHGVVWWSGYTIPKNLGGVADSLINNLCNTKALIPAYTWINNTTPAAPVAVKANGKTLKWKSAKPVAGKTTDTVKFVVYNQPKGVTAEKAAENPENIVEFVYGEQYTLPADANGTYFVTALDRANNESAPSSSVKVK